MTAVAIAGSWLGGTLLGHFGPDLAGVSIIALVFFHEAKIQMSESSNNLSACQIFICYADTGGGHKYAAEAVRTAIEELVENSLSVKVIVETVIQKSNVLNYLFVELYNYLLRNHQDWVKYYCWSIEFFKPNQTLLGYKLCGNYLRDMLLRVQPSIIVSVHPMVNHYMAMAIKDAGLSGKTKLIIVVTDPNSFLWSGWACSAADLIIVPNDLAQERLVEFGIAPERICAIGMPIEPVFLHPPALSKENLFTRLGLDLNRLTVLLSGGWAGGGAIAKIYQILKQVKRPIQIIILCGHNDNLFAQMNKQKDQSNIPTVVLAYTESLSSLMSACDLLITKGGGLTTFEAIARRLPMALDLLTQPMPQEIGTVDMLIEANLAKPFKTLGEIVPIVESLKIVPNRESQALPTVHNLDHTRAIYDIAKTILSFSAPFGKSV